MTVLPNKRKLLKKKPNAKTKEKTSIKTLVQKEVKKEMAKEEEHKSQSVSTASQPILVYNAGLQSLTTYDATGVLQNVIIGGGAGSRIGNKIMVTKALVRGFISNTPGVILANIYMRIICYRLKNTLLTPNGTLANLFQLGNSTQAPTGTVLDLMRTFNRDLYVVYSSKKVLLGSSDGITSNMPYNNSQGAYMFTFDLKKIFGGSVLYNDTTALPTNKSCYISFIPCNADGTAVTAPQMVPFAVTMDSEVFYTDS